MEKKKKIIFSIPSAVVGGIENHLSRQLRLFSRDEYDISVILLFAKQQKAPLADILPKDVPLYQFNFKNIYDIKNVKKLWKLLKEIDPDIVVASAFDANALFRILKPCFHYVAIPRLHNLYPDQPFHLRITDRILGFFSPTIVAVSEGVADYAAKRTWMSRKKFTVIPNGIDLNETEQFKKEHTDIEILKKELGFTPSDHIILNVSRLRAQKNLELAINTFAQFKKQTGSANHKLVIVGDGGEREKLERLVSELGLEGSIVFAGLRRDTFKFYMIADMFLLTSIREGFPNVLLEAMAFGVPFVSTRVPGATEAIKDGKNGFLADSAPEVLAEKLAIIANLTSEEKEKYRGCCFATARKYSMKENVKKYKTLFSRVVD